MKSAICVLLLAVLGSSAATLLPNPKTNYTLCSRPGPSRICDPDGVLSRESADSIDKVINDILIATPPFAIVPCNLKQGSENPGFEVAVAIWNGLRLPAKQEQNGSEQVASLLFNHWELGGSTCKAGVLILLDANTTKARILTSSVIPGEEYRRQSKFQQKESLSDDAAADIVGRAQKVLLKRRFDKAVKQMVIEVGLSLAGHHPRDPLGLRAFMRMNIFDQLYWAVMYPWMVICTGLVTFVGLAFGLLHLSDKEPVKDEKTKKNEDLAKKKTMKSGVV